MSKLKKLPQIKPGQQVTRVVGRVETELLVTHVTRDTIECGSWTFDRWTGAEIDEDLDWGPPPKKTGSYLKELTEEIVEAVES